jgi:hypothetical protein
VKLQLISAEQQAIAAANSYLQMGGFSRARLISQLSGFGGAAVAKFAVNHIHVNWDNQAVQAAGTYMLMGDSSCTSLVQQLDSPDGGQFTYAQAVYAAKKVTCRATTSRPVGSQAAF